MVLQMEFGVEAPLEKRAKWGCGGFTGGQTPALSVFAWLLRMPPSPAPWVTTLGNPGPLQGRVLETTAPKEDQVLATYYFVVYGIG